MQTAASYLDGIRQGCDGVQQEVPFQALPAQSPWWGAAAVVSPPQLEGLLTATQATGTNIFAASQAPLAQDSGHAVPSQPSAKQSPELRAQTPCVVCEPQHVDWEEQSSQNKRIFSCLKGLGEGCVHSRASTERYRARSPSPPSPRDIHTTVSSIISILPSRTAPESRSLRKSFFFPFYLGLFYLHNSAICFKTALQSTE